MSQHDEQRAKKCWHCILFAIRKEGKTGIRLDCWHESNAIWWPEYGFTTENCSYFKEDRP